MPNASQRESSPSNKEISLSNCASLENITKTSSNDHVQILLFPPKDKQFTYDEGTCSFKIEPIKLSVENVANVNNLCSENESEKNPPSVSNQSGLTPLIAECTFEKANISSPQLEKINDVRFKEILKIENVFRETSLKNKCFLKGCKWSPDGLCLLSNSEDNVLRLFEISETLISNPLNDNDNVDPVLQMKEGGTIYDYEWYPKMNSADPVSCVFASASQDAPIHLWDAYTGQLRATYQPINQYDEVTPAFSLAFTPDGSKIYSGYRKLIRIFDLSQPGRISEERPLKIKGNTIYQSNIVSAISINPAMDKLYAIGSYDKTIGIYAEPEGNLLFMLRGHSGGITQIKFTMNGYNLFSGGRKDSEILCWDIRNPGKVVFSVERQVATQQRIHFDLSLDETLLLTGTTDCYLKMYNVKNSPNNQNILEPICVWRGHEDCVNGVNFHPKVAKFFASASGQRHFPSVLSDDDSFEANEDDDDDEDRTTIENCLKIWSFSQD